MPGPEDGAVLTWLHSWWKSLSAWAIGAKVFTWKGPRRRDDTLCLYELAKLFDQLCQDDMPPAALMSSQGALGKSTPYIVAASCLCGVPSAP